MYAVNIEQERVCKEILSMQKLKRQFSKTKKLYISTGIKWGFNKMGIFTSLAVMSVLSRPRCGYGRFGFGRFGGYSAYRAVNPSATYFSTCYCDLERPTGLSSWLDGGRLINAPYEGRTFSRSFCGSRLGLGFGFGLGLGFGCLV